ncbi:GNAT family N-acetyltransferase [Rothia terrae]|uniref:GNAT family N-acetyltransferase n=1 Tax=Rothia terrae TaxID=396015 RepID=UPI0038251895
MSNVRFATREDIPEIIQLVKDLAAYEKEPASTVKNTVETLTEQLFCNQPALYAYVLESDSNEYRIDGFAIWFLNYSTWEGSHGIYLEDLYIRPEMRGTGGGRALLKKLAQTAKERGYKRIDWVVLDWNKKARNFYENIGAKDQSQWVGYRLEEEGIQKLATE